MRMTSLFLLVSPAKMRLISSRIRARRAAEPSEPESEEATEPVHHEHSHPEHHEHEHEHGHEHEHHYIEHHPNHDYNHIKDKFMNELNHLSSKTFGEFSIYGLVEINSEIPPKCYFIFVYCLKIKLYRLMLKIKLLLTFLRFST